MRRTQSVLVAQPQSETRRVIFPRVASLLHSSVRNRSKGSGLLQSPPPQQPYPSLSDVSDLTFFYLYTNFTAARFFTPPPPSRSVHSLAAE